MTESKHLMRAFVSRGEEVGLALYPHKHKDGMYVVSKTRLKQDYTRVATQKEALAYVRAGLSLRMSNPNSLKHRASSLISPGKIEILAGESRLVS